MLLRNSKSFKRCYSSFTGLKRVVVFEGDGIGPEIVSAARKCIDAALVSQNSSPIQWLERDAGSPGLANLSEDDLEAFDDTKLMFKGPLTIKPGQKSWVDLRGRKFSSSNQVFRKIFELYANIRPSKSYAGVDTPFKNVDWVVFRENTEDVYTGEETVFNAGQETEYVEGVKRNSRLASRRIAQRAAEFAVYNDRRHITVLHKANVCKLGDGLWLSETLATARAAVEAAGSSVGVDDQLADSFLCNAVQHPHHFDIILCPNLIGDFVSDMAGGLIGSLGLCGSANVGDNHALFEAAHGSAPDIAGQSKANPISMTLSGALLLRQIGEIGAANSLEKAIEKTVANKNTTSDLGGNRTTNDCTQAIIDSLE